MAVSRGSRMGTASAWGASRVCSVPRPAPHACDACVEARAAFPLSGWGLRLALGAFVAVSGITLGPEPAAASAGFLSATPLRPTVFGETGYSGVLSGGALAPVGPRLALGGELILDAASFGFLRGGLSGRVTVIGAFKLKTILTENRDVVVGLDFTPGFGVQVVSPGRIDPRTGRTEDAAVFAWLLSSELHIGKKLERWVTVGGGLSIPMLLTLGDQNLTSVAVPILIGPFADFQIVEGIDLYTTLKLGPALYGADAGSQVDFGLDFSVGLAFAL